MSLNSVKKLLTDGLNKNQYLKRLELQQIKDMVECMYERTYLQGEYVVKQGEPGNHLFVLAGRSTVSDLLIFLKKLVELRSVFQVKMFCLHLPLVPLHPILTSL